jgi:LmbE family N-acetylglucosaminyl deacetylase
MSNSSRFAARPLSEEGTSITQWLAGDRPPPLDLAECPGLVVVAPHPDDETLGLGGTIAQVSAQGVDVMVVSVSDGGAAYPDISRFDQLALERTRRAELDCAARVLGVRRVVRLGLPDGRIAEHEQQLADQLAVLLATEPPATWCAATWEGDGHPDYEAVGRAAATATTHTSAELVEYPVWMWHWAGPDDPDVPWSRAASVPLDRRAVGRKQNAAQCYRSQIDSSTPDVQPVLPPFVVRRLLAVGEVLFR